MLNRAYQPNIAIIMFEMWVGAYKQMEFCVNNQDYIGLQYIR